jgi:tetratricopeptide (TPR) repeat protein
MKCVAVILMCLALVPCSSQAAKRPWRSVQSRHFTVIGDAGEKQLREAAFHLEQFHAAVSQLFERHRREEYRPITVIIFREESSYRPFTPLYQGRPTHVSGYFQAGDDAIHIVFSAGAPQSSTNAVIFHEYVHVLTSNNGRTLPTWLNEGIAEYYSTFGVRGDRTIRVGQPIASHLRLLRERPLMPLATLLAVTESSPLYNEREKKSQFYAQSWALVHYLMVGNQGYRQRQFQRFIQALMNGAEADFRQAFQAEYATIEHELETWLGHNRHSDQQVTLDGDVRFDGAMQTALLSEADVQAHLGDLLWRIHRTDEAEVFLQRALALEPTQALANRSLGMLRFRQRRFADAARRLRQAAESNPQDPLAHYYHAVALQQEPVDEMGYVSEYPAEMARAMRASLEQARRLAPAFPESYKQLAFINLVRDENLDEAVTLLNQALALAPDREDFRYTLARVHLRRQNYASAREVANRIIGSGSKSDVCERARQMLDTIGQIEAQLARAQAERAAHGGPSAAASPDAPPPLPGKRFVGEQVRGLLTRVDCTDASITLSVKSDARTFRFHKPKFGDLIFVRYTIDIPITITCGPIAPARPVIVTYRKPSDAGPKSDGEPVGVEFIKP